MLNHVFFAFTADGYQFDGCVASNATAAEVTIRQRYADLSAEHFVGGKSQTSEELISGMTVSPRADIDPDLFLLYEIAAAQDADEGTQKSERKLLKAHAAVFGNAM